MCFHHPWDHRIRLTAIYSHRRAFRSNSENLHRSPVQSANSRIGPFASQVLNLTQSIHQKNENLQWEKCRYITDKEKTFSDTARYFHSKHLKNGPNRHKKTLFSMKWYFKAKKIFSKIYCELLLHANFTKLWGSLCWTQKFLFLFINKYF